MEEYSMIEREELELILKLIGKYNLPLSPILEYAVKEKMEEFPEEGQMTTLVYDKWTEESDFSAVDYNNSILSKNVDIRSFCLSTLSCLEGLMDNRSYQILSDMLNGVSRRTIALKHGLTQERIRQIVVKATKQAKELLMEQHTDLAKEKEGNARLNVQLNLMSEEIVRLKALLPKELLGQQDVDCEDFDSELAKLLETPLDEISLPARASNILSYIGVKKFVDIPLVDSSMNLLKVRNSGRKTVHDVSCMLDDFHLTFGMSYAEIVDVLKINNWKAAKRKWMVNCVKSKEKNNQDNVIKHESAVVPVVDILKNNQDEKEKEIQEETTIVLTRDIIEAARTPNGGFTKSQLTAIGIGWPPPQDWIKEKVGTMITQTQFEDFNHIEYVTNSSSESYNVKGSETYKNVASNMDERRKMEAILQAMTHFYTPATPYDIARTISHTAWGGGIVREETVDRLLKMLPEVEHIKWGKYILKSRNISTRDKSVSTPNEVGKTANISDDKRIGYTVRLFPSQLKGEILRVRKNSKGIKKLVVKATNGDIVEVDDLPYLYEVLKRN